ncbi:MAG: hypothetical protein K6G92_14170 [Bacteroidaceae bacterium]|nr:hypothetical protein [Bacteroidaceae bacterium]
MQQKKINESVLDLMMLVNDKWKRRKLFNLFSYLEDEYCTLLAKELKHLLLTGRDTLWLKSRLLMRFYCIAKRVLGLPADEADFDLKMYHCFERFKDSIV